MSEYFLTTQSFVSQFLCVSTVEGHTNHLTTHSFTIHTIREHLCKSHYLHAVDTRDIKLEGAVPQKPSHVGYITETEL